MLIKLQAYGKLANTFWYIIDVFDAILSERMTIYYIVNCHELPN